MDRIILGKNVSKSIATAIRKAVQLNKARLMQEIRQSRGLYEILQKWKSGTTLNEEEREFAISQLLDIAKTIPTLTIFMLPFGGLVLFFIIKYLPIQILPKSFYQITESSLALEAAKSPVTDPTN